MTDLVAEFRRSRVEQLSALIDCCADEQLDTATYVGDIIGRIRELYFFASDLRGMVERIVEVATRNNLLEWARSSGRALTELPWARIKEAAEEMLAQPPLHVRDWSRGAIEPQFPDAYAGWIYLQEWADRVKIASGRHDLIDDGKMLTGTVNTFEHMASALLKALDPSSGERFENIVESIIHRHDFRLDMLPAALTYFGSDGLMVLNYMIDNEYDCLTKLEQFTAEGLFDADVLVSVSAADTRVDDSHLGGRTETPSGAQLSKGANISLTTQAPQMTAVTVGLGWDVSNVGVALDLDASALACGADKRVISDEHFVFYHNLLSPEGTIEHTGDNRTGDGDGETVNVDLEATPPYITNIFFVVSIHDADSRGQSFGQVRNAFIRIVDQSDGKELARYDLTEDAATETAMVFGELYRHGTEWRFRAIGQGYDSGLAGVARDYGVDIV